MTPGLSVFISHSSNPYPDEQPSTGRAGVQSGFIKLLEEEFGKRLEILVDQSLLKGSDDWRHEIHTWMGLCQAAVVLFSPGVVKRPDWVCKEAIILEWRQTLDPGFVLIPVLLPGFTAAQFGQLGLDPAFLSRLQLVQADTVEALATKVRPILERLLAKASANAPLSKLVNELTNLLLGKLTRQTCETAAAGLGGEPALWSPLMLPEAGLARAMVHAPLEKIASVVCQSSLALGGDRIRNILDLLTAFWLRPEAPALLPEVVRREPGKRAAALNSESLATAKYYIWRGFGNFPPGCKRFPLLNQFGEDPATEAREELRKQFRAKMAGAPESEITRQFERFCGAGSEEPVFVLLQGVVDAQTLGLLQVAVPGCTFLVLAPQMFTQQSDYLRCGVEFLRPELDPHEEQKVADVIYNVLLSLP